MDDVTKTFLDKCSQTKETLNQSGVDVDSQSSSLPLITKLDIEEIFAVGGESTTVAAVQIGVSAISA